jgi:hypothetical protein
MRIRKCVYIYIRVHILHNFIYIYIYKKEKLLLFFIKYYYFNINCFNYSIARINMPNNGKRFNKHRNYI